MPRRWKRGIGPGKRGRHKKHRSRETRKWNRMFDPRKRSQPGHMQALVLATLATEVGS